MAYWVDDTFDTWPETYRAGKSAAGLYLLCGAYCARNLTDGRVPLEVATSYGTKEWIQRLVDAGLWEVEEHGYRDVFYLVTKDGTKLNPTREEVLKKRKQAADRQQRWRENAKNKQVKRGAKPSPVTQRVTNASHNALHDASRDASPSLPPSKEGRDARPRRAQGAARVPQPPSNSPSDVVQAENPDWRNGKAFGIEPEPAEAARARRGAAAARASVPKRTRHDPGPSALDRLREAVAELPPLTQPPSEPPEEPLADVIRLHPEEQNP